VIPENIHTLPRAASWNSKGAGGEGFLDWNFEGIRGYEVWISKRMEGVSALNFQRGKTVKAPLEIADLLTFLVCN